MELCKKQTTTEHKGRKKISSYSGWEENSITLRENTERAFELVLLGKRWYQYISSEQKNGKRKLDDLE